MKLTGKKRILGILGFVGARLLQGFGLIDAGTATTIETISGGIAAYGLVDASKRKEAALKEAAKK